MPGTRRLNWIIHGLLLGLAAAALIAGLVKYLGYKGGGARALEAAAASLALLIGAGVLTAYALASSLALRGLAHIRGAALLIHGLVVATALVALRVTAAIEDAQEARQAEAQRPPPEVAHLHACLHVRALEVDLSRGRARVTLESSGCPLLKIESMRLFSRAPGVPFLSPFGSFHPPAGPMAPGPTATLTIDRERDRRGEPWPPIDGRSGWHLEVRPETPRQSTVVFRTAGLKGRSGAYGLIERTVVAP